MPMVNVDIKPEVIRWALSQADEEQIGVHMMDGVKKWIDGTKKPTFNQIEAFSKKVNIPLGYFFLQAPPEEKIQLLEYRTVDSAELVRPSRDLIDTIHEMERIQDWMKEYRLDTGFSVLPIVGSLKGNSDVDSIAQTIRNDLDLDYDWYKNSRNISDAFNRVRSLLEYSGIVVMLNGIVGNNTHRALNIEEFRAFAMVDEWAPLIFINNADSQGAKLFSLFHEMAHIWLGEDDLYNDRIATQKVKPIEVLCNAVASELMVPFDLFINEWSNCQTKDDRERITIISKAFKCGESVIARKALDAKKINNEMYKNVISDAIKAYKDKRTTKASGGDYYKTMASRLDSCFVRALCESVNMGRTTYTEACKLTNTSRKTFPEIAAKFGGTI